MSSSSGRGVCASDLSNLSNFLQFVVFLFRLFLKAPEPASPDAGLTLTAKKEVARPLKIKMTFF
jgi:hypothetical protein